MDFKNIKEYNPSTGSTDSIKRKIHFKNPTLKTPIDQSPNGFYQKKSTLKNTRFPNGLLKPLKNTIPQQTLLKEKFNLKTQSINGLY